MAKPFHSKCGRERVWLQQATYYTVANWPYMHGCVCMHGFKVHLLILYVECYGTYMIHQTCNRYRLYRYRYLCKNV